MRFVATLAVILLLCGILATNVQDLSDKRYNLIWTSPSGDDFIMDHNLTYTDCVFRQNPSTHWHCELED